MVMGNLQRRESTSQGEILIYLTLGSTVMHLARCLAGWNPLSHASSTWLRRRGITTLSPSQNIPALSYPSRCLHSFTFTSQSITGSLSTSWPSMRTIMAVQKTVSKHLEKRLKRGRYCYIRECRPFFFHIQCDKNIYTIWRVCDRTGLESSWK